MRDDYKWTLRRTNGVYYLSGYVKVGDEWSLDGATMQWSYIEAPLEHIVKQERDASLMMNYEHKTGVKK